MIQTNYVFSNDYQGRVYQNYKFHDPRGRGSCARAGHIVKMHYFFKKLFLYTQVEISQTKYKVIMTKKESTKITPGAGVLLLGHGNIGSENAILLLLFLCTLGHGSDKLSIL